MDAKGEKSFSGAEDPVEVSEDNETEGSAPVSENNEEQSEAKQEPPQDVDASENMVTVFSYDQLKAKSDNPVTGIDFKRREVSAHSEPWSFFFLLIHVSDGYSCFPLFYLLGLSIRRGI